MQKLYGLILAFSLPFLYGQEIVSREGWGALDAAEDKDETIYYSKENLEWLVIHHTGPMPGVRNVTVNLLQVSHMNRGKSDIAYNWVIDKNGIIYEGRPWNVMSSAVAPSLESHIDMKDGELDNPELSLNYGTLNICLIGNFTKEEPTLEQRNSLLFLADYIFENFQDVKYVIGHNEMGLIAENRNVTIMKKYETLCPGDIENLIDEVRRLINR